jgi:hypothetical protein
LVPSIGGRLFAVPSGEVTVSFEPPSEPPPRGRRGRRTVAVVVIAVVALGALGGGVAAAKHQHDEQVRKERIAAEKRAAAAYVQAVRPVADRVYDAVQPIQDALDAFSTPRPGLYRALVDVVTKGRGEAELKTARSALVAKPAPATHRAAGVRMTASLNHLIDAVHRYDKALRVPPRRGGACEICGYEDDLENAEVEWSGALQDLEARTPLSEPGPGGGLHTGAARQTRGGFIHAADLVCARASNALDALPELGDVETVRRLFPRMADTIRSAVTSLHRIKLPAGSAVLAHRLDVQLKGATGLAKSLDELSAALKRQDPERYRKAQGVLDEELEALERLSATYTSTGATSCAQFFSVPEEKTDKAPLRA